MNMPLKAIALGARLKKCRNVRTIGVRPNIGDYSPEDLDSIRSAPMIYYPSGLYAEFFTGMNKPTFPTPHTYAFAQDKILQTGLFTLCGLPHPQTRIFYGPRQKRTILDYFHFPMIAKIPRGSAMGNGVFLIENRDDLEVYLSRPHPAYIQAYLASARSIRVVLIGYRIVLAYWRIGCPGDFRSNVARGAKISMDPIPREFLDLALLAARKCRFNDVGIDLLIADGTPYIIEANMRYGRKGFEKAGIDYHAMMDAMIEKGWI